MRICTTTIIGTSIAFILGISSIATLHAQNKKFNIKDNGAVGDGVRDNTVAIQKTIDQCFKSGGGVVLVPAGKFMTGVIELKSNVELKISAGAEILGSPKRAAYGPENASPLICATGQQNIAITGDGTINGQGEALLKDIYHMLRSGTLRDKEWQTYNEWHQMRPEERNRPNLIFFNNCDKIRVQNVTIKNGLCWIQEYRGCTNIIVNGIKVISNTFLNNDGIDLVDCKNVKLTNSFFNVADDGICLKSSNPNSGCDSIFIADCKIRSSASAFKMGTASAGGFKNITVRNLFVYDTFRSAVAIESVDGGLIENIDIRHVIAKNTGNAIFIRLGKRSKTRPAGRISHVFISDVEAEIAAGKPDSGYHMEGPAEQFPHHVFPSSISGIPGHPVESVTLNHINIIYKGYAKKELAFFNPDSLSRVPERLEDYPEFSMFGELPASALYIRHAQGITLKNINIKYAGYDFRTPFVFDDVKGVTVNDINFSGYHTMPLLLLKQVKVSSIKGIKPVSAKFLKRQ